MVKIVVLEKLEMAQSQRDQLCSMGEVQWLDGLNESELPDAVREADIVVVDWVDPSSFILSMKSPSLLALNSTGYGWIAHRQEARDRGVLIANVPEYATEAVAEHAVGLMLDVARHTSSGDRMLRYGQTAPGMLRGVELCGKQLGILGLGRIGTRVSELAKAFNMEVVAYSRHPKGMPGTRDVSFAEMLETSDIVLVSCPLNDDSRRLFDVRAFRKMKPGAILVAITWGVVVVEDLAEALSSGALYGAGLDVALEANEQLPSCCVGLDNLVLTPHLGFNTAEAKTRQIDELLGNISNFKDGKPSNAIN